MYAICKQKFCFLNSNMLQEVSGLGRFDHILGNLNSILMYVYHCRYIFFFFNQVHYQPSVTYSVCLCTGWSKHYYRSSKSKFPTLGNVHHDNLCLRERIGSYWIIPKSQKFVDFFRYVSGPQSFTYPITIIAKESRFLVFTPKDSDGTQVLYKVIL